jgi:hypothetical protein
MPLDASPHGSVVLVHGLDSPDDDQNEGIKTWTAEDGTVWPRDLLPSYMPGARVLCYEYNGSIKGTTSIAGIRDNALALLRRLEEHRPRGVKDGRPIIFVGHSLGGVMYVPVVSADKPVLTCNKYQAGKVALFTARGCCC